MTPAVDLLLEQADALDLHDLRATGAIENVRVQARALADAVHERGWGDIFLGIDSYDPDELDDLPLAEASARSGMSVGALKVATHRAMKALRKRLGVED